MASKPKFGKVGGRNATAWVHPWERDTTRGYPEAEFPTMHNSEMKETVQIATCQCCGVDFGFTENPEVFCPSHRWLGKHKYLGKLMLRNIKYDEVTGYNVIYSYFIPEDEPKNAVKLQAVLTEWFEQEYGKECRLPKVLLSMRLCGKNYVVNGVVVNGLQRVARDSRNFGVDAVHMARILDNIDRIYCEVL